MSGEQSDHDDYAASMQNTNARWLAVLEKKPRLVDDRVYGWAKIWLRDDPPTDTSVQFVRPLLTAAGLEWLIDNHQCSVNQGKDGAKFLEWINPLDKEDDWSEAPTLELAVLAAMEKVLGIGGKVA